MSGPGHRQEPWGGGMRLERAIGRAAARGGGEGVQQTGLGGLGMGSCGGLLVFVLRGICPSPWPFRACHLPRDVSGPPK